MIKPVTMNEINDVMVIINDAKAFMKLTGSKQWQGKYPNETVLRHDIETSTLYGCYDEDKLVGIIAIKQEFTKNYVDIEGKWSIPVSNDDIVLHRLCIKKEYRGKGVATKLMNFAIEQARVNHNYHLKTDTHPLNVAMQKTAEKAGFKKVGIVKSMLEEEDIFRLAYELNLDKE